MNILFLNNFHYLRGGSERILFEEIRLMREAGHNVAVFSRANPANEPSPYDEYFPPSMDTERIGASRRSLATLGEIIYSHPARRGLRRVIEEFRPDVAHAHNIYGRLSVSVLDELKAAGVPVVLTLHDLKLVCPSYLMLSRGKVCEKCRGGKFYHALLSRCHRGSLAASAVYAFETWVNSRFGKYDPVRCFISPSSFLRDKIIECRGDGERIVHVPNFIDVEGIADYSGTGGHILFLGRLSPEKGTRTLLGAYGGLRTELPLLFAGDGPERGELERVSREAGLSVEFAGHLGGGRLGDVIAGARVVVVPSECYENAPMSILEAMAHGKPVIGARIGGIPEMIVDGKTGFLFEPGNVADLQRVLDKFLSLPERQVAEMGKAARLRVAAAHGAPAHYDALMGVYAMAIGGDSRPVPL